MDFIEEAKKEYDILIFDTPPILSAADAVIIGAKADGVLLVYRIGAVSKGLLRRASSQLEQVRSHVIGVVLNGMRPDVSPDFEDYKHYTYYSSYGAGEKEKMDSLKCEGAGPDLSPEVFWKKGWGKVHQGLGSRPLSLLEVVLIFGFIGFLGAGFFWQTGGLSSLGRSDSPRLMPSPDPGVSTHLFRGIVNAIPLKSDHPIPQQEGEASVARSSDVSGKEEKISEKRPSVVSADAPPESISKSRG